MQKLIYVIVKFSYRFKCHLFSHFVRLKRNIISQNKNKYAQQCDEFFHKTFKLTQKTRQCVCIVRTEVCTQSKKKSSLVRQTDRQTDGRTNRHCKAWNQNLHHRLARRGWVGPYVSNMETCNAIHLNKN